jgi:hypothetical protein
LRGRLDDPTAKSGTVIVCGTGAGAEKAPKGESDADLTPPVSVPSITATGEVCPSCGGRGWKVVSPWGVAMVAEQSVVLQLSRCVDCNVAATGSGPTA